MWTKRIVFGAGALLAIGLLLWGGAIAGPEARFWKDTDIRCLPNGHERLALHIHPVLRITVDGTPETVPANVGNEPSCMSEVHTHDETGTLHVETTDADRAGTFKLADFFAAWGRDLEREGYEAEVLLNGAASADPGSVPLGDHDVIEVIYTSVDASTIQPSVSGTSTASSAAETR